MTNAAATRARNTGVEFRVLGTVEATAEGTAVPLGGPKQRAVLAVLVVQAGHRVSTDYIVDALYGDLPPEGARRSVQTYVSNLRRELGDMIQPQPNGYLLDVAPGAVDASRFEDALEDALAKLATQPASAAETIREALSLWRGHPFADVDGGSVLAAETSRLMDRRLIAVEARIEAGLATGRHEQLIPELAALTAEHPYREKMRSQYMLALYRSGRQADALRAYEQTRSALLELGLEPSPEVQELNAQILNHDGRIAYSKAQPVTRKAIVAIDIDGEFLETVVGPADRITTLSSTDIAVRDAIARHGGHVFAQRLNATFADFEQLDQALAAATEAIQSSPALGQEPVRPAIKAAVDVGDVESGSEGTLVGPVVTRSAGLVALARPGQVLLSTDAQATASRSAGWTLRSLGEHAIPGLDRRETLHQLVVRGLPEEFPQLRPDATPAPIGGVRSMPGFELRTQVRRSSDWVMWRAYQPSVGREVAIKVMRPELAGRPEFIRRFELQALTVARLEHPRIVPLYDYWRDLTGAYLVHPWIDGPTLGERAINHPLDLDEAARMLVDVGSALDAAHGVGVAHGDVSPEAIVVDPAGAFYLTDFGIGDQEPSQTSTARGAQHDIVALASTLRSCIDQTADLPGEAVSVLDRAATYTSVAELSRSWQSATGVGAPASDRFTSRRNPYRGLGVFTVADAEDFFGRDEIVAELIDAVGSERFTAVVGPSGVGKSSLIHAGLLPALLEDAVPGSKDWFVAAMHPGSDPYEALAAALLRVAVSPVGGLRESLADGDRGLLRTLGRLVPPETETLLLIDQFEELFTLAREDERAQFLKSLSTAVNEPAGKLRLVITLRADFFDQPLAHPSFGALLRSATFPLSTPTNDELGLIVELPAARVGVGQEPGLVARVLADAGDEPGRLPLVEYALTETFEQRTTDVMRIADYDTVGGVVGALGRAAEATYERLSPAEQEATRQLFLRLVTLADGERIARRRVRTTELDLLELESGAVQGAIEEFSRHRLLTLDRDPTTHSPTVEVAHEAIFTAWPRLVEWIEHHRGDLVSRRRLLEAAAEWEAAARDDAMLLTGTRLVHHQSWATATDLSLTRSERDLIDVSTRRAEEHAEEQLRRRRRILRGFAAAALVATVLAVAAWVQRGNAQREAARSQGRALEAQADRATEDDPELGIHLALAAIDSFDSAGDVPASAVDALRRAIAADRITARVPAGEFVAISPDQSVLATGHESGGVALRDGTTLALLDVLEVPGTRSLEAYFADDPDELFVAVLSSDAPRVEVVVWDLSEGTWTPAPGSEIPAVVPTWVDVSPSGELLALLPDGGKPRVVDRGGAEPYAVEVPSASGASSEPAYGPLAFSDDGELGLVVIPEGEAAMLLVLDGATGSELARVTDLPFAPLGLSFSPDGRHAAIATIDGAVGVIDLYEQRELWSHDDLDRSRTPLWLDDGRLAIGGEGPLAVLDAMTGAQLLQVQANRGGAESYVALPGTQLVATAGGSDGETLLVDVSDGAAAEIETRRLGIFLGHVQVDDGGDHLLIQTGRDYQITKLDSGDAVMSGRQPPSTHPNGLPAVRFSRNGRYVAAGQPDGAFEVLSVPDDEVVYTAPAGWHIIGIADDASLVVIHRFGADNDGGTQLVRVANQQVVQWLDAGSVLYGADFTPDGQHVLTNNNGSEEPSFRLWATADGRPVNEFGRTETYNGISSEFTRDGRTLVIAGHGGEVFVFDVPNLVDGVAAEDALVRQISAHNNFSGVVVSHDGSLIASAAFNEPMRVWDLATGERIGEFGTPDFTSMAFHPSEPWVLVGEAGVLSIHTLDVASLIDIAQTRLSREMTEEECQQFLDRSCDRD